ncbi:MAG TPA: hypothetical protein ENH85_06165 [Candidatus Scalindua sp.]|nr:hypothetical protein [Candidatus Scalindua sp.]
MDKHEMGILRKLRKDQGKFDKPYSFWFVYDDNGIAITYEGGFALSSRLYFRNQYTIPSFGKRVVENWSKYVII